MSREGTMISKLKEGLQEALVFLRQLGDFRIPAVMERRRKGLLDKLLDLQGDTFRGDTIPKHSEEKFSPEPSVKLKSPEPERQEKESEGEESVKSVTSPRDSVTSPTRADSKISALVGNYESITMSAKKEEEAETPKRLFVQLKKVAKPTDFPDSEKGNEKEEDVQEDQKEPVAPEEVGKETSHVFKRSPPLKRRKKENGEVKTDRPPSTASGESENTEAADHEEEDEGEEDEGGEKESGKKKSKFQRFKKIGQLGDKLGGKLKKIQKSARDRSPSRPVDKEEEKSVVSDAEEDDHPGENSSPEHEEGVKLAGVFERKVASKFKTHKWVKMNIKLKDNVLFVGDKEQVELTGYLVSTSDVGFDIVNHGLKKQIQFRLDEGENGREKWVEAINAAIEESTPEQEESLEESGTADSAADVPSITVEEPTSPQSAANQDTGTLKKKQRDNKTLAASKLARKLPELGVEMKGYMYRKKPGLGARWDKTYCVLTFQAMYFTSMSDNEEYNHMLSLMGDMQKTMSESKGRDRNSKGINLKLGNKKEQLSVDTLEFEQWKGALERVLGIGGVEELLSEDEDIEEDIGGDLYEELETDNLPPPVPSSPRPSNSPVPDDIIIDEDIYEDTDDYQHGFNTHESPVHSAPPPALPDRNPQKPNSAAPSLPPRKLPTKSTGPALPPRSGGNHEPQQYEETAPSPKLPAKAPAKPPPPEPEDMGEDIYDDVVPGGAGDVVGEEDDVMEETYDDVVLDTKEKGKEPEPITEDYYEDMVPGVADGPEEYLAVEPGAREDIGGEELYVDVDTPPPQAPPTIDRVKHVEVEKTTSSPKSKPSGTFSRMFKGKTSSPQPDRKVSHSGTISHKPPKKHKFEERWVVVEGNFLIISKNSTAKSHQEKLPLSECGLDMGSPDVGPGEHAFRITGRGDRVHHFKLKAKLDLDKWVTILKGLTKYAPIEAISSGGEQQVYQATEDHIGESAGELTFKKGTFIRLISKDADNEWVGQIGNEAQVFEGQIGKFPVSKVTLVEEDLYI